MGNLGYISYRLEMRFFFGIQHVLSIFTFLIKQSDLLFLKSKANIQEWEKEQGPHLLVPIVSLCDSQLMRGQTKIYMHILIDSTDKMVEITICQMLILLLFLTNIEQKNKRPYQGRGIYMRTYLHPEKLMGKKAFLVIHILKLLFANNTIRLLVW